MPKNTYSYKEEERTIPCILELFAIEDLFSIKPLEVIFAGQKDYPLLGRNGRAGSKGS